MKIAFISGTSIVNSPLFSAWEVRSVETKHGVVTYKARGEHVLLNRHGFGTPLPPHAINYRANIRALADLGFHDVVSLNSVGSLKPGLPPGRGDLAIRSSDRHLFFVHPTLPVILETTLYGHSVRTITLGNVQGPPAGVAYDQKNDRLLILEGGDLAHVSTFDLAGKRLGSVALDHNVRLVSLAYDSSAAEFYVPLLDQPAIGIFDTQGHLLRTLSEPDGNAHDFVDVGQRSLLRLF